MFFPVSKSPAVSSTRSYFSIWAIIETSFRRSFGHCLSSDRFSIFHLSSTSNHTLNPRNVDRGNHNRMCQTRKIFFSYMGHDIQQIQPFAISDQQQHQLSHILSFELKISTNHFTTSEKMGLYEEWSNPSGKCGIATTNTPSWWSRGKDSLHLRLIIKYIDLELIISKIVDFFAF